MKNRNAPIRGFTLIEIMIVVAIIGLLATIAIPSYGRARNRAYQTTCIGNLGQIEGAIETWATETRKQAGEAVEFADISAYLRRMVVCPAGGKTFSDSYQITRLDEPPVCVRVPGGEFAHLMQF
jgi:prepilin-type N-terminal cleavage/methylation domain-containing protein